MTENKNVILSARDIVVEFDVRDRVLTAIRGVSLDLVEGEVLALVGESGSGKSVLTKTFTGMLEENGRVASGSIDYRGQDLTKLKSHQDWTPIRGAKIATIFQDPMTSLDPIKTIGSQIVEVIVKHQGKSAKEAKKMAIDYMDKLAESTISEAEAIDQLTTGVDQISSVVQTNSATSEESAAASEQLSSQAVMMKQMVQRFRLRGMDAGFAVDLMQGSAKEAQEDVAPMDFSSPSENRFSKY